MRKFPIGTVLTALLLVVVFVLIGVTYQVRFSEFAVRTRFGKPQAVIDTPGFGWKLPPPIEMVKTYDKRLRVLDTPETEVYTQDGQVLIVGLFALWQISDPLLFHVRKPSEVEAEAQIRSRLNEVRSSVIGRHNMSELFNLDEAVVKAARDKIESEIRDGAAPGLMQEYGVKLVKVQIRRNTVPVEATGQIQAAMIAERDKLAKRFTAEGKSTADGIKARAQTSADQIRSFAERRAQEIESAGIKASESILAQIKEEDSEFFIWLRQLEALEAAFKSKGGTIFLDSNSVLFRAFVEPFRRSGDQPAKKPAAPAGDSSNQ